MFLENGYQTVKTAWRENPSLMKRCNTMEIKTMAHGVVAGILPPLVTEVWLLLTLAGRLFVALYRIRSLSYFRLIALLLEPIPGYLRSGHNNIT